jgi:predicted metal-dependent HD superfamily phosphohydrolase
MEANDYILFDDDDDDTHICVFNMKLSILGGSDVEYDRYDNSRDT